MANNSQLLRLQSVVYTLQEQFNVEISPKVEFRGSVDCGVGIYATSDIAKSSPLIKVPFSATLTADRVVNYEPLSIIFQENPSLLAYPDEVLAIGLIYAYLVRDACPWGLHVVTMPNSFDTPLHWEMKELEYLKGTNVYHLVQMLKRQVTNDYATIYEPLSEAYPELLGDMSLSLYIWALSVIYSRALDLTRHGTHIRCIVPLLDMANHNYYNHSEHANQIITTAHDTFHYDLQHDCVCFIAGYDISSKEECYAVYGNYCNAKLLHTYGFVCLHNPYSAIDIWTKLLPNSNFYEQKSMLLEQRQLSTSYHTYDFAGTIRPNFVSTKLITMIRIIQATEEELLLLSSGTKLTMVSVRNEQATYTSLIELLSLRLNADQAEVRHT